MKKLHSASTHAMNKSFWNGEWINPKVVPDFVTNAKDIVLVAKKDFFKNEKGKSKYKIFTKDKSYNAIIVKYKDGNFVGYFLKDDKGSCWKLVAKDMFVEKSIRENAFELLGI
jgi:hypothetical protein